MCRRLALGRGAGDGRDAYQLLHEAHEPVGGHRIERVADGTRAGGYTLVLSGHAVSEQQQAKGEGMNGATSELPSKQRAEQALRTMQVLTDSPNVFETFFEQARLGLALADLSARYVRVNQTYADLLGRPPEDLIGVSFAQVLHPADRREDADEVAELLSGRERAVQSEQRYVDRHGNTTWVLHGVTVVSGPDGRPAWFAVSAQDITERRRAEEDLRALSATLAERAVRDPLTGLANRTLFEERLKAVLARDARTGQSTAVLFLDLDGFKDVNDSWGHAAGDIVLRTVGERLSSAVRPSDTVARIGGDEFVVLVEGADQTSVQRLIERLKTIVGHPIPTLDLEVGVSIGVALAQGGMSDPAALLSAADASMYAAKSR
jgi:diguanylate cyclase (GGDEF)-like protein/PAS domain S-box-containing protein